MQRHFLLNKKFLSTGKVMEIGCHSIFSVTITAFAAINKEITKPAAEIDGFGPKFEPGTA
jgi:hypothetical protein